MLRDLFNNKGWSFHFICLALLCLFVFFLFRDSFFVNIMEARNFVTAREMVQKGNWLIPTMNGELRLAKPPFPTWVTGLFGYWFGIDNVSMLRFPASVMASLMVFFMYGFTFLFTRSRRMALVNGLVLGTTFYIVYMGRTGTWDIYCHSFMLAAIWMLFKGWQKKGKNWGVFLGAGCFLGLSFLSKGPVAFYAMLLPFLISYLLFFGGRNVVAKWKPFVLGIIVFLIISFWWPAYIYLMHAQEAVAVANLESTSWINRHVRPFWYYWNFPIQSGVWTLFIFSALAFPYGVRRFKEPKGYKMVLFWTLLAVVLLSLFPEKKDRYLLPVMIPSAMLVGYLFEHFITVYSENRQDKWDEWLLRINTFVIALVALSFPVIVYFLFFQPGSMSLSVFISLSIIVEGVFALLLFSYLKRNIYGIFSGIVLLMVIVIAGVMPYVGSLLNKNPDFKNIRQVRENIQIKDMNWYSCGKEEFRIELVWEVGKQVRQWDGDKGAVLPETGPFVIFSTKHPLEVLSDEILNEIDIEVVDCYDYNRNAKEKRRYKDFFRKYMSIIYPHNDKNVIEVDAH